MNHQSYHRRLAALMVVDYCADCRSVNRQHDTVYLRAMIEEAAKAYASCTTPQQAYEALAEVALDSFNAHQASIKKRRHHEV